MKTLLDAFLTVCAVLIGGGLLLGAGCIIADWLDAIPFIRRWLESLPLAREERK